MATYKVLQDVEAEDKIVGALTLRQFVYAGITALFLYLSFFAVTKNVAFLMIFFVPPALFTAFLAIPWHGDQPTEVWALAKLRFYMKPRKRIWDQSGAKNLVTVTAPKQIERHYTNGLSQHEVRSRLRALSDTVDSRGWALKNATFSIPSSNLPEVDVSDRLVAGTTAPQTTTTSQDLLVAEDILATSTDQTTQNFDSLIAAAHDNQRQQITERLQAPSGHLTTEGSVNEPTRPTNWFLPPTPAIAHTTNPVAIGDITASGTNPSAISPLVTPGISAMGQTAELTAEEVFLVEKLRNENNNQRAANDRLKRIMTPKELAEEEERRKSQEATRIAATTESNDQARAVQVTSTQQAAIMNLAQNDDLDVATLARQAKKEVAGDNDEVVISLR